jgi:16S rRNA (guanine1207-N2)-methyltransferase
MKHYFTDDGEKHEISHIGYEFRGAKFRFAVHDGIFSKAHVDHATDILLNTIPALPENSSLLDMGCGYGVIGIVLAKTYNLRLTQADINPAAIKLTRQNAKLNGVETQAIESDCFDRLPTADCRLSIVINPPIHAGKAVTYRMYEQSREYLAAGGSLYVVTFKKHGAESTIAKLREVFGGCETLHKKKGIYVLKCQKYKQI